MRHKNLIAFTSLFACFLASARGDDLKPKIDALVNPLFKEEKAVGIVVGVITKDGRQVFGYGKLAKDNDRTPDGDTLFEIGSITKTFTATVLADMALEGLLNLDDPIRKHLPSTVTIPKRGEEEITLSELSTHTSGLPRVPVTILFKGLNNPYAEYGADDLYETLGKLELKDEKPKHSYSNFAAGLLGHILALKANQSYEELIVQRICTPLGMKDTRIALTDEQKLRYATGHDSKCQPVSNWDFDALAGAGALRSTANDMLTYAAANMGMTETRLAPALEMCHQQRLARDEAGNSHIGLSWVILRPRDSDLLIHAHGGGTGGYSTFLGFVKQKRIGVVVLTNRFSLDRESNPSGIAVRIIKELIDPAPNAVEGGNEVRP